MKILLLSVLLVIGVSAAAQQERDTVLKRCPVSITDTVSVNNFFIEALPVTMKVYRVRGKLTIQFQQRDQFFTLFFHEKKLRNTNYAIEPGSRGKGEVEATYSFRSGQQASYIVLSSGQIESVFDKEKNMWRIKVNGMITNLVERAVTYYKAKADFFVM